MRVILLAFCVFMLASCTMTTEPEPVKPRRPVAAAPAKPVIACSTEIGAVQAQNLAKTCREVSPATRPPCNVENSCEMIRSEIERSCLFIQENEACMRYQLQKPKA